MPRDAERDGGPGDGRGEVVGDGHRGGARSRTEIELHAAQTGRRCGTRGVGQGDGVHRRARRRVAAGAGGQHEVGQLRHARERADLHTTDARRAHRGERHHPLLAVRQGGAVVGQREGRRGTEVVRGTRRHAVGQHPLHRHLQGDDVGEQGVVERHRRAAGHPTDVAVQHRDPLRGRIARRARVEGDRPLQPGSEAHRVEPAEVGGRDPAVHLGADGGRVAHADTGDPGGAVGRDHLSRQVHRQLDHAERHVGHARRVHGDRLGVRVVAGRGGVDAVRPGRDEHAVAAVGVGRGRREDRDRLRWVGHVGARQRDRRRVHRRGRQAGHVAAVDRPDDHRHRRQRAEPQARRGRRLCRG